MTPLQLGGETYAVVQPPASVTEAGYTQISLVPRIPGTRHLTRVAIHDGQSPTHVVDLARLYYFAYYRRSW